MENTCSPNSEYSKIIKYWLSLSRYAASGGNQQPWRVHINHIDKNRVSLTIRLDNHLEDSLTDTFGAGSLISLGCFVATLNAVGASFQIKTEKTSFYCEKNYWDTYLDLEYLLGSETSIQYKLSTIQGRRTYRGPYKNERIKDELVHLLVYNLPKRINIYDLSENKDLVSKYVSDTTFIRLTEKYLFNELMNELFKRNNINKTGLPIDTLGLSKFSELLIYLIKNNNLFFSHRIYHLASVFESIQWPLKKTSHLFYLSSETNEPISWFEIGYNFQNIWYSLSEHGIALQPLANNLINFNYFTKKQNYSISDKSKKLLEYWQNHIKNQINIDLIKPGIMFRIGYPKKLMKASPRKKLEEIVTF